MLHGLFCQTLVEILWEQNYYWHPEKQKYVCGELQEKTVGGDCEEEKPVLTAFY